MASKDAVVGVGIIGLGGASGAMIPKFAKNPHFKLAAAGANVEAGGLAFSSNPQIVEQVVKAVRPVTQKFLIVKLSPNVTDICEIAQAAEAAGADAVSLVNTYVGMALDINTRKPYLANDSGGLSGPAIKPIALNMVYQVSR